MDAEKVVCGYSKQELEDLRDFYRSSLLEDTLRFWVPGIVDEEFGGYLSIRDKDGSLIDDDKSVWLQGRFAWMLATLCNTVEKKDEWLSAAKSGVEFLKAHCFDEDGQMFFLVTREGKPLRKRRYFYSEAFAVMAFAAYGKASGNEMWLEEARKLFAKCMRSLRAMAPIFPSSSVAAKNAWLHPVSIVIY